MRTSAIALAFFIGLLGGAGSALATPAHTSTVIDVFPGPNAIANALQQANSGDPPNIHAGTYPEHFSITTTSRKSARTSGSGDAGIYIGTSTSTPYGPMVVQRNETFDNTRGIIIEDSAGGIIQALRNDVHANTATGLWLHNSDGVTVRAN